ncbi:hypothetical protein FB45DRAFT_1035739 [Roridomyces roridus]|uniref:Uncharacterized protein n=1 Tax=Roridomyces roridus TaxID=1738132 RepID=A0AAD7B9S9_9AGAR|nr:hypothetical protein FB45DRAFT_1035739 [Roridomyces roridus]
MSTPTPSMAQPRRGRPPKHRPTPTPPPEGSTSTGLLAPKIRFKNIKPKPKPPVDPTPYFDEYTTYQEMDWIKRMVGEDVDLDAYFDLARREPRMREDEMFSRDLLAELEERDLGYESLAAGSAGSSGFGKEANLTTLGATKDSIFAESPTKTPKYRHSASTIKRALSPAPPTPTHAMESPSTMHLTSTEASFALKHRLTSALRGFPVMSLNPHSPSSPSTPSSMSFDLSFPTPGSAAREKAHEREEHRADFDDQYRGGV